MEYLEGRKGSKVDNEYISSEPADVYVKNLPSPLLSFLPVILPIVLIALKSIHILFYTVAENDSILFAATSFLGEPVVALGIGVLISLTLIQRENRKALSLWLTEGVEKAGIILAIIAAGGMFGEMLQATGLGKNLSVLLNGFSMGIFFPFVITAILKTAQGSSTVAIITASSLVAPLLGDLGLDSPERVTLAILSMGAGSMMISHANDAYYWVISRFSNIGTAATLKVYSIATLFMGLSVQLIIWALINFL
jgi:gluconate:H+ symporter, GntP family